LNEATTIQTVELAEAPPSTEPIAPISEPSPFTMEWLEAHRSPETQAVSVHDVIAPGAPADAEIEPDAKPFTSEWVAQRHGLMPTNATKTAAAPSFDDFFSSDDADAFEFLEAAYDHSPARYNKLVDAIVTAHKGDLILRLGTGSTAPFIAPEELAGIPQSLHSAAKSLTQSQWDQLSQTSPEFQREALETVSSNLEYQEREHQAATREYEAAIAELATRAFSAAREISDEFTERHRATLAKWKPFGDDVASNNTFRELAMERAQARLANNSALAIYQQEAIQGLRYAEIYKARGDYGMANIYTGHVRKLFGTCSEAFGNVLRETQKTLEPVIKDALAWRAHQKATEAEKAKEAEEAEVKKQAFNYFTNRRS
jgi:hypothetical protein